MENYKLFERKKEQIRLTKLPRHFSNNRAKNFLLLPSPWRMTFGESRLQYPTKMLLLKFTTMLDNPDAFLIKFLQFSGFFLSFHLHS